MTTFLSVLPYIYIHTHTHTLYIYIYIYIYEASHNPDNHDSVITHLEPDILECKKSSGP